MKYRRNLLKKVSVLIIFSVLLFSNFFVFANAESYSFIQNIKNNETLPISYGPPLATGYERILNESFEDNKFPPDNWKLNSTNKDATWERNDNDNHWGKASAYCYPSNDLQDESLITPSLSFVGYNEIYARFFWQMENWWYACYINSQSLHIRISTDGGKNWKIIWHEDYWNSFENNVWQNTNRSARLDLSEYIGEPDVKFDFRVIGDQGEFGGYIAIDDIEIWVDKPGTVNPLICGIDGPFEGEAGGVIQFKGWAEGGQYPYYWEWDFGDDNQSSGLNLEQPTNLYLKNDTSYDVYCRVYSLGQSDAAEAIITIYIKTPEIKTLYIRDAAFGIGFNVKICNDRGPDAIDVNWTIHIYGGFLNSFETNRSGHFDIIKAGESKNISCWYFIGFGGLLPSYRLHAKIKVESATAKCADADYNILKIGPFVLGLF